MDKENFIWSDVVRCFRNTHSDYFPFLICYKYYSECEKIKNVRGKVRNKNPECQEKSVRVISTSGLDLVSNQHAQLLQNIFFSEKMAVHIIKALKT